MFKVLIDFADLWDKKHIYHEGDKYPREGYTPEKARIQELCGNSNAFGKPIIVAVKEKKKGT